MNKNSFKKCRESCLIQGRVYPVFVKYSQFVIQHKENIVELENRRYLVKVTVMSQPFRLFNVQIDLYFLKLFVFFAINKYNLFLNHST